MKVLFLSSWYPTREYPQNGDFVERHAIAVSEYCEIAVLHVTADHEKRLKRFEIHSSENSTIFQVIIYFTRLSWRVKWLAGAVNKWLYIIGYLKGYREILKAGGKPDLIHANIIYPVSLIACMFKFLYRIPFVISEHWTLFSNDKARIPALPFLRFAVKRAYAIMPVSANLQEALLKHGFTGRYHIVPNVVDIHLFGTGTVKAGSIKQLLHVSSMKEHHKNITGIIRTIKHLSAVRNDFSLTFAGNPEPHQINLTEKLGLSEVIRFKGELSHAEVAEIMKKSHLLVMFSRYENLPCVILEALSAGIPVISTDVGGIREWINESNGRLIQREDESGLLDAILYMMDHIHDFDGQTLHRYAEINFSKSVVGGLLYTIYKQAVNCGNHV